MSPTRRHRLAPAASPDAEEDVLARLVIAAGCIAALLAGFLVAVFRTPEPGGAPHRLETVGPGPAGSGGGPLPGSAAAPPGEHRDPEARGPDAALRAAAREAERQEEAARRALLAVAEQEGLTLEQRLDRYREDMDEALEGSLDVDAPESRAMLTEVFLRMERVQRDLAAMSPGARQSAINHVRREMDYSEAEIARLEARDAEREARWQRGAAYMEERRRLVETFEGEALEEELRALRERVFGHEAPTIAREEESGFFRYERPRVYGRN